MRHSLQVLIAISASVPSPAACGSTTGGGGSTSPVPSSDKGSVVDTGDIAGTFHPAGDSQTVSDAGRAKIHIIGPASGDDGFLVVGDDHSVLSDIEKYGDFSGTGATFRPGKGFSVDSDIATARGKKAHVKGDLSC